MNGDLTMGGAITLTQTTANSTRASSLIGVVSNGTINGNVTLASGGSITANGEGAEGMLIGGNGVVGNITIGGTIRTIGVSTTAVSVNTNTNAIHAEGGLAFGIGASVSNGIEILGAGGSTTTSAGIIVTGTGPAVEISPTLQGASNAATTPLKIGVYTSDGSTAADGNDPGFSFYNRGTCPFSRRIRTSPPPLSQ